MNQPLGETLCQATENWGWDKNKKDTNIRLVTNMVNCLNQCYH